MAVEKLAYEINEKLLATWMEREGLTEKTPELDNAIKCVEVNAEGRLKTQGTPVTKETMQQAVEEVLREEIELTGGVV